jgi:hypothetical protein
MPLSIGSEPPAHLFDGQGSGTGSLNHLEPDLFLSGRHLGKVLLELSREVVVHAQGYAASPWSMRSRRGTLTR